MERTNSCKKIIFTLFGFVVFWAIVTDAWGYSAYIFRNDPYNMGTYIYGYLSRCIWVIPAILLIIRHSDKLELHKHELYQHIKFDKPLIIAIVLSFVYVVIGMLINHKSIWFNSENFLGLVFAKYIVVGFVEETVFRGWGYNSLVNIMSHKKAAIISTVFFVL
ncbi:MAG: CPBP family intramembrane metalloprotease, partial [Clostridia bacterium]|nr:CPBP family intramembrane metalloprotease [Clostridia bacterium]